MYRNIEGTIRLENHLGVEATYKQISDISESEIRILLGSTKFVSHSSGSWCKYYLDQSKKFLYRTMFGSTEFVSHSPKEGSWVVYHLDQPKKFLYEITCPDLKNETLESQLLDRVIKEINSLNKNESVSQDLETSLHDVEISHISDEDSTATQDPGTRTHDADISRGSRNYAGRFRSRKKRRTGVSQGIFTTFR